MSGSSESLESGESDWTFFFLIALSSEGVEVTEDPTPERKLELFSSIDELRSYPLRWLARRSAAAFSSGDLSSSKMSSSSSGWLTKSRESSRIRHYETRCYEGSTSWWIERSSPQQARKRELFLVKDFHPCSYEETYEAWKVEQEGSCYLDEVDIDEIEYSEVNWEKRQWNAVADSPWKRRKQQC